MATSTLSTVENALKTIFKDPIITQLDNGSGPIMAALEKNSDDISGGKVKFSLEYGRSGGVGARAESGTLPTPSPRKYELAEVSTKNLYARMALTDKLLRTTRDNAAAFANQFTQQMNNLLIDANDMLRRNVVGKSTGVMGTITSAVGSTSTEFTLDGSAEAFYPGQYVDFGTVSSNTFTKSFSDTIADVDYDNHKIYTSSGHTTSANTVIVLNGNYGLEMTGIEDIMTATTLYGIDRSSKKWFKPTIVDIYNSATSEYQDFDSLQLQKVIDIIEKRTGDVPNFLACDDGIKRAYIDEQNTYKRNLEMMNVDGGYKLISYNGIPITVEKYMAPHMMDIINTNYLKLSRLTPWDWMDEDGAILHRQADTASYEATLVMYGELVCKKPAALGRFKGIANIED